MDVSLSLAIVLVVIGFVILLGEFLMPSGVLAVISFVVIAFGVVVAFLCDRMLGLGFLIFAVIGVPFIIAKVLKVFPNTFIGRALLLSGPKSHKDVATTQEERLQEYIGRCGTTVSRLRPAGIADFDGERIDVISEGMIIEKNVEVEVVSIRGNRVVVREVEKEVSD